MIELLRRLHRFLAGRLFYPCAAASALAVTLLAGRMLLTGTPAYRFLIWNLLLAWLPYLAALGAAGANGARGARGGRLAVVGVYGLLWLLFLPNAPYIMTDFVHLPGMTFVWWYEIGTLLAFAWSGCILGVASLHIMQGIVRARAGAAASWAFVLLSGALCGLGIYLGRFLRWNSWDVFTSPRALARELLAILADPASYPRLVGVSGLFACFLLLGYLTLLSIRKAEE
jgi:uncharacterized membrane protein